MLIRRHISKTFLEKIQTPFSSLFKQNMSRRIPGWQKKINELKFLHGDKVIEKIKVSQVLKGMEGLSTMFYTASILNPKTGVTYRGYSIEEIVEYLPKAEDGPNGEGDEPLPESLISLLITGELPTPHEYEEIMEELKKRRKLSPDVKEYIKRFPKEMHPMTQLSAALLYLEPTSSLKRAVLEHQNSSNYWQYVFEDAIDIIAKLPELAAIIYRHKYKNDVFIESNPDLDWAGNFAHMLGFDSFEFKEFMRGHLTLHADCDGGDVSSHTSHMIGTAHVDPYLAYSAAINGMAGPLNGSSNHESLKWLINMQNTIGPNPTDEKIKKYIINHLTQKLSIPGYGHATLTHIDSRFSHEKHFIEKYIKNDPLVTLCEKCYKIIPGLLKSMRNEKNPWPTVDALSGVILNHYGLKESEFFIVLNAVARSFGCMANLVVTNALEIATERPISINLAWLENQFHPT